jgi:murein DD-endopeptidase MepM/ murein hydrolase activator NlpD
MKRALVVPVLWALFLTAPMRIGAVDWPSAGGELRSSFGQNDRGRPSVGMAFEGEDPVRSMDAGEILFVSSGSASFGGAADGFPNPLGDWMAVDHGNGIIGVYARLATSESAVVKTVVEKGSVLSSPGTTGWVASTGYYFSVYDRLERRWVNPAMIAPQRVDTRPPTIRSIDLVAKDGQAIRLAANRVVRQGVYRVLVEAVDTENSVKQYPLSPQRIMCLVNGAEQGSLHLETIKTENGTLMVSRTKPAPAGLVYQPTGSVDLGEIRLNRGRTTLELIARDAPGNERISTIAFMVE